VVLLCGCDKTTPALVMGACSVDIPSIVVSGGPMLTGKYQGNDIGTSDVWRFSTDLRAGLMTQDELNEAEAGLCRSQGHCAVMGTASSMACLDSPYLGMLQFLPLIQTVRFWHSYQGEEL
jgi:dihydroxy-acid dehydratase